MLEAADYCEQVQTPIILVRTSFLFGGFKLNILALFLLEDLIMLSFQSLLDPMFKDSRLGFDDSMICADNLLLFSACQGAGHPCLTQGRKLYPKIILAGNRKQ